jgi:hypothetical protein
MNYRQILARNVAALMKRNELMDSHAKLARYCSTPTRKIGARTIGHLVSADSQVNPKIDTIVAVAEAFKIAPWLLLTPDFDPARKGRGDLPPPEIIELAKRILTISAPERELLMTIFSKSEARDLVNARAPSTVEQPTKTREYDRAARRKR